MMKKVGVLVAATALAAFAAASSDAIAAAKKKSQQGGSFSDTSQCTGGSCTAVNPDRVPSEQHQYRHSRKKHHMTHKS
jgi:hypothetical protein